MKVKIGFAVVISMLMLTPVVMAYGVGDTQLPEIDPWKQCMENAEKAMMFGQFTYDSVTGEVSGRFVEFTVSMDGRISDYTVKREDSSIKVFDEVYLETFTPQGTPRVEGAMFQYTGAEANIMAHNNPPAVLHFTTVNEEDTVVYVLAEGFTATKLSDSYNVRIQGNGLTGYIINGESNITIENNTVVVSLPKASHSLFRAMPVEGPIGQRNQAKIMEKIEEGKVIGEVSVSAYGGEKSADIMLYGGEKVQISVQNIAQNRVEIRISADYEEGKTIVINVDKETIKLDKNERIAVKLDGNKINRADVDTVLNANDNKARYSVEEGTNGYQIYVYIPHFSDHTITAESESTESEAATPGFTTPALLGGLIISVSLAHFIRKKRKTH